MTDYYKVLGIKPTATLREIKNCFRKKAKEHHPDTAGNGKNSDEPMMLLLDAYETLSDPWKRAEYDKKHAVYFRRDNFDYKLFLAARKDDMRSQSKLIFYNLLHNDETGAVEIYNQFFARPNRPLEEYMDREDFMDCAFLLAEEFEKQGQFDRAYELLRNIVIHEYEKPYFRHFFEEVILRFRILVSTRMPGTVEDEIILMYLQELVTFHFSNKDTAFFLKQIAELYHRNGNSSMAREYLHRGMRFDQKLPGAKSLQRKIEVP